MKITIYKGFNAEFFSGLNEKPLTTFTNTEKLDPLFLVKKIRKIKLALLDWLEENDGDVYITYEEFSFIQNDVISEKENSGLEIEFVQNNYFPSLYPLNFTLDEKVFEEIENENASIEYSPEAKAVMAVFEFVTKIGDRYYGSYCNIEETQIDIGKTRKYYKGANIVSDSNLVEDAVHFVSDDAANYIEFLQQIEKSKPQVIGFRPRDTVSARQIIDSLLVYAALNNVKVIKTKQLTQQEATLNEEILKIMKEVYGYTEFRSLRFYTDPANSNETHEVSQGTLVSEMVDQAEKAIAKQDFNDIFITAPTGSGKSLIFQLPAMYIGKKHQKLTIVIEPVKALMKDQKDILNSKGYFRVEFLNGDLTPGEKDIAFKRIKDGEVDLLYLSPETLLSYSIDKLIGDRDIGLVIVDEAHIVTTWGRGFRPDYWYLGSYIRRLRFGTTKKGRHTGKVYNFPICAFTATAVYGPEGTIDEIENSLTMDHGAIEHIGYVKRDNIQFRITVRESQHVKKGEYLKAKSEDFSKELHRVIQQGEKEIVYFPYATDIRSALYGGENFGNLIDDIASKVGVYTGANVFGYLGGAFTDAKNADFEDFRVGKKPIMLATKAFGMGVDVNDVNCVYHWAPSGNLQDYVQEIGRAARKLKVGIAAIDFYQNDMSYMRTLFGMSAIRDWQMEKVIAGIYDAYKSNGSKPNFLISPDSFTYIFSGDSDDEGALNKLKTCLLMIEKDFLARYPHPVLISRPRPIFTKAFVCLNDDKKDEVLNGKYGKYFKFVAPGRKGVTVVYPNGRTEKIWDNGDIYELDLQTIWEKEYYDMSFPAFKYCFFTPFSEQQLKPDEKKKIMPEIEGAIAPRIQIDVESKGEETLSEIYQRAFDDLDKISALIKKHFGVNKHFTTAQFTELLRKEGFGKMKALNIANSVLDLVDPTHVYIKFSKGEYHITNGNFAKYFRAILMQGPVKYFPTVHQGMYQTYMSQATTAKRPGGLPHGGFIPQAIDAGLKFLAIMEYINYTVVGGKEPQIFIRLNSPEKLRLISEHKMVPPYKNRYISEAQRRHEDDVAILSYFFQHDQMTNDERWTYIEDYFLGRDIFEKYINAGQTNQGQVTISVKPLVKYIDVTKSNQAPASWSDAKDDFDASFIAAMIKHGIPMAKYELTEFLDKALPIDQRKAGVVLEPAMLSWPDKNVVVFDDSVGRVTVNMATRCGWRIYYLSKIDFEKLKGDLA